MESVIQSLLGFADLFLSVLGLIIAAALAILLVTISWMYVSDISQTRQAIRRNYPVIGRFRYFFEHLGEFFRQYFFALDREELPFNRAQRTWVYRASKNEDSTIAFGSTQPQTFLGSLFFSTDCFRRWKAKSSKIVLFTLAHNMPANPTQPIVFLTFPG